MRVVRNVQIKLDETDVSQTIFDLRSRDDISVILHGLQHLYMNEELRQKVFELLESEIAPEVNKRNGRPGMTLWSILVCGVLRLDLNADYDRLHELVNQHRTCQHQIEMSAFLQSRNVRYPLFSLCYEVAHNPSWADLPTGMFLQG
jgi:transposase, IS5 family